MESQRANGPAIADEIFWQTADSFLLGQDTGTPARLFVSEVLQNRVDTVLALAAEISDRMSARIKVAYSTKTNSDPRVLKSLLDSPILFDVISLLELKKCIDIGIISDRLIVNGPGKWWPLSAMPHGSPVLNSINCDSLSDVRQTIGLIEDGTVDCDVIGLRLSPVGMSSRFGLPCESAAAVAELVSGLDLAASSGRHMGLQCHLGAHRLGRTRWTTLMITTLNQALRIAKDTNSTISQIDLGGGWPAEWLHTGEFERSVSEVINGVRESLKDDTSFVIEPGRLIARPAMVLLSRVLSVHGGAAGMSIVVDASVADLPSVSDVLTEPKRIQDVWWRPNYGDGRSWIRLEQGPGRILGRLCMERDILAPDIGIPDKINAGDMILFSDAGGYDASMAYSDFGT